MTREAMLQVVTAQVDADGPRELPQTEAVKCRPLHLQHA